MKVRPEANLTICLVVGGKAILGHTVHVFSILPSDSHTSSTSKSSGRFDINQVLTNPVEIPRFYRALGHLQHQLGYFILPMDVVPDLTPAVGLTDDLGAIVAALAVVAIHIKPEHQEKARDRAAQWFGAE